jgi:cytochrome oxidase Cu insertion factor (SCO1/SenC/PrrC family)
VTQAQQQTPVWKNPFVVAFVLGAAALTALPFLQKRFLKAPPPLRPLGAWELSTPTGDKVGAATLKGKVFIVQALGAGCLPGCAARLEAQASIERHLDDLGDRVLLVTVVVPVEGVETFGKTFAAKHSSRWLFLSGSAAEVDLVADRGLRLALVGWGRADAGTSALEFSSLPSFSLVDQNGDVRGFWAHDELGRGNLINAARLLAKAGPSP